MLIGFVCFYCHTTIHCCGPYQYVIRTKVELVMCGFVLCFNYMLCSVFHLVKRVCGSVCVWTPGLSLIELTKYLLIG
jgi:hypothetical protein